MEYLYKPDYDMTRRRFEAFWNREIIDRPPVSLSLRKPGAKPFPTRKYATYEQQWLDIDSRVADMDAAMANTDFLYDSLPIAWPNLGPEIFSAWCGCGYKYGQTTTWSEPIINDWETDFDRTRLDMNHPLFRKMVEFTQKLIDAGRGKFIVGLTDLHPGGDHVAALRDPQNLAMDMLDEPEYVKKALARSMPEYYAAYGVFYNMIRAAGMPATSWLPIIHDGTFYIPSNDFSCMISNEMFEEFFMPGIAQECKFYERSIYHLDGPGALHHLDSLLAIPELDAIQWVPGAGREGFSRWVPVYQRIQKAKKGIYLACHVRDLPEVFDTLRPEGVWFASISGIYDKETAEKAVKQIERWHV
ncbi:MAG: hypothetical protein IJC56_06520 [Clostridia bacterium]|nr:hypothetical protein [Clostridia bacterium]